LEAAFGIDVDGVLGDFTLYMHFSKAQSSSEAGA
jgi:3-deoxy-D-manno-octulosonate 8-phosphate phosphatase KdsC-like HAD superfamily phosphatase